ncbi:MAG: UDP-glucose/GDP-mannose dehydrogenase family protein [Candidatus Aminicenantes bacterium]|nr:UDP-glucose/GDP-mannose dehydrogenase family protein [Candidatus Aminicenantes bacterium]
MSDMNVIYIGAGYVGACSAAVSADSGHNTLVYDVDKEKIRLLGSGDRDSIEASLFEEGLGDLLVRNSARLAFTSSYRRVSAALDACDAVFMCLPTPEIGETGESDLSYYDKAARKLAASLAKRNGGKQKKYVVIVNKSTVPVGMADETERIMRQAGVRNFGVVSNPEFLVEGQAVQGSLRPDRVVVGAKKERDFTVMQRIYQRFRHAPGVAYIEVSPKEAAAGKLLANFMLFNRLAVCFDVVGRTCEAFGDIAFENVRRILHTDPRIGGWGLYDSLYAGGSCFNKDARSLSHQLKGRGLGAGLVEEVYRANKRQLDRFLDRAEKEARFSWTGKRAALLGTAFKRNTNDIRNSPSLVIAAAVLEGGAEELRVYDPQAMASFKRVFPPSKRVRYCRSEAAAVESADAVIVATDWPQFRGLGDLLMSLKRRPLLMDGRRMLQHLYPRLRQAGFSILAVGSPFLKRGT